MLLLGEGMETCYLTPQVRTPHFEPPTYKRKTYRSYSDQSRSLLESSFLHDYLFVHH